MKSSSRSLLLVLAFSGRRSPAQQMPDPKAMSGVPLPVADLPAGTVTVARDSRAADESAPGSDGRADRRWRAEDGEDRRRWSCDVHRADAGHPRQASVVVDGERIESQEFEVPAATGSPR